MKKLLLQLLLGCSIAFTSCGPNAEEKAAAEKATQDSIAAIAAEETRKAVEDSMMAVQAVAQKAIEDSLRMKAMEDSLAIMKEKVKKATASKPPKNDEPKVGLPGRPNAVKK